MASDPRPPKGASTNNNSELLTAVGEAEVILCLGSGGVGKTTAAAALAIALAQRGERVVVLTIDPARRLADALGQADGLSNEPRLVQGDWGIPPAQKKTHKKTQEKSDNAGARKNDASQGELWATMLDPSETLKAIVTAEATDPAVAERILNNRLFVNLTKSLSGTNEYMATERLHQLVADERFERVIVDTPPSRHAIDFLDSPGRLTRFVNHRLYRSVFAPRSGILKTLSVGSQKILGMLGRLVGSDLVDDVISFFADFEGLDVGFKRRAEAIAMLLASNRASYVLITSPRSDPINEAQWILGNLEERDLDVDAIIVNRVLPLSLRSDMDRTSHADSDDPIAVNFEQLTVLAEHQAALIDSLSGPAVMVLPEQDKPITDLGGLTDLATTMISDRRAN